MVLVRQCSEMNESGSLGEWRFIGLGIRQDCEAVKFTLFLTLPPVGIIVLRGRMGAGTWIMGVVERGGGDMDVREGVCG